MLPARIWLNPFILTLPIILALSTAPLAKGSGEESHDRAKDHDDVHSHLKHSRLMIASSPITSAVVGVNYNYTVVTQGSTGGKISYSLMQAPSGATMDASSGKITWVPTASEIGSNSFKVVAKTRGGIAFQSFAVTVVQVPSDPSTQAPPSQNAAVPSLYSLTQFLYSGANPVQTGVAAGTIQALRVSVIRGKVLQGDGTPLAGVTITVKNHPEFGQTLSRLDGMFDLAVNGGGELILDYSKGGFLSAQRTLLTSWRNYSQSPNVTLLTLDPSVTEINLSSNTGTVHTGSLMSDSSGVRQASVYFPKGVQATAVLPDGTQSNLSTIHVRATEFTVGSNGPTQMPAELPKQSQYTYAVEFSIDEAISQEATKVVFSQPVPIYTNNFLNFPVGLPVPVGYYDRASTGKWIALPNGRVIQVLSVTGGVANLDIDGSGTPASSASLASLGITASEQSQIAGLFQTGQSFWRATLPHFTPADFNWSASPLLGATNPTVVPSTNPYNCHSNCGSGSIIDIQNRTLSEKIRITGTPFTLFYNSGRAPGFTANYTVSIPLFSGPIPSSLLRIDLTIVIEGRTFTASFDQSTGFPTTPYTFTWDGLDAYGRAVSGARPMSIFLTYAYPATYTAPAALTQSFGRNGGPLLAVPTRTEYLYGHEYVVSVGQWTPDQSQDFGGWTLDIQHAYDPASQVLHKGDGSTVTSNLFYSRTISTFAGNGIQGFSGDGGSALQAQLNNPMGLTFGPDGSMYIADSQNARIRKVDSTGNIQTVAGNGTAGYSGDGGPATQASLNTPRFALMADGSILIADSLNNCVRFVNTQGIISTIVGTCGQTTFGYSGDGGPASLALLNQPSSVTVDPAGGFYIADTNNEVIRKVGTDGIITTVVGNGVAQSSGDGGPALQAGLFTPSEVIIGDDGITLYIDENDGQRIRKVDAQGNITTIAGTGVPGFGGDGGPGTLALIFSPAQMMYQNGNLIWADSDSSHVRELDANGIISTIAGSGNSAPYADNILSTQASLNGVRGVIAGPDGVLYISDTFNNKVMRLSPLLPIYSGGNLTVPSRDGSEVYVFNADGRHLKTLDALTGATKYQFTYDASDHLVSITDRDGNITSIQRGLNGSVQSITSPYGQVTQASLTNGGLLASLTNPNSETFQMAYGSTGLLSSFTDPRGFSSNFSYDNLGKLVKDQNAAQGFLQLSEQDTPPSTLISLTTAEGRISSFETDSEPAGGSLYKNTDPSGLITTTTYGSDGTSKSTFPDQSSISQASTPDPYLGMVASFPQFQTSTLASGLSFSLSTNRQANFGNVSHPLGLSALHEQTYVNGSMLGDSINRDFDVTTLTQTLTTREQRVTSTVLNSLGRVSHVAQGGITPVDFGYDSKGRLTSITQGTRVTNFSYNGLGFLQSLTDSANETVSFQYDGAGRVTQQTLPDGRIILKSYDASGNLSSITPPGRPAHGFDYTPVDLVMDYNPPALTGNVSTQYSYNKDKELTQILRPDGLLVLLNYDAGGRLSSETIPQGQINYSYDMVSGNLTQITAPDGGQIQMSYDGSLLTGIFWTQGGFGTSGTSLKLSYDNQFRMSSQQINVISSFGTLNLLTPVLFSYDQDSLLTKAGDLSLTRDAQNGRITNTTIGQISDSYSYNGFSEILQYQTTANGNAIFSENYTRDNLGRITAKSETVNGTSHLYNYAYDAAGRLTDVFKDAVKISHYDFDLNSNRVTLTTPNAVLNGTYDNQDRLLTYGNYSFTYTQNGELKTKTNTLTNLVTQFNYDVLGNLRSVTLEDGTLIEYLIDGLNRRIGKKVNGTLTKRWAYADSLRPIAEFDGDNNLKSQFVYGTKSNVPDYSLNFNARIISDHLGSPKLVVDPNSGQILEQIDYDEFGNVVQDTNPGLLPFGFAGCLYDQDTKLCHFGARDYDPMTGRWLSKDPIGFGGRDSNFYSYTLDDPINYIDQTGQFLGGLLGSSSGQAALAVIGTLLGGRIFGIPGAIIGGILGSGIGGTLFPGKIANENQEEAQLTMSTPSNTPDVPPLSIQDWANKLIDPYARYPQIKNVPGSCALFLDSVLSGLIDGVIFGFYRRLRKSLEVKIKKPLLANILATFLTVLSTLVFLGLIIGLVFLCAK